MLRRTLTALVSGLIFGLGLTLSEMINPQKVLAFLDITGNWDPSLALVLATALATTSVGYRLVMGRHKPLFESEFFLSTASQPDLKLLTGSGLFGIGWGLAGFCPGPALSAISLAFPQVFTFLLAMLIGMFAHHLYATHAKGNTPMTDNA